MNRPADLDLREPAGAMAEVQACRHAFPDRYIKLNAIDSTRGWESVRLSFIVQRPSKEPGFGLERQEGAAAMFGIRRAATRPNGRRVSGTNA